MTSWRRRLCAGLVTVGLIAPSWAAAGVTLHVFFQHDESSGVDIPSLDAFLHGHRHATEKPDHEHALFAPSAPAKTAGFAFFVAVQGRWRSSETAVRCEASARAIGGLDLVSGAGPPSGISPLRV